MYKLDVFEIEITCSIHLFQVFSHIFCFLKFVYNSTDFDTDLHDD